MTAKEYLSQGYYLNQEIDEKSLELESLKSDMCRCTQNFSDEPPGEHNDNNTERKLTDYIDKCKKLEDEINAETDKLIDIKIELRERILKMQTPKYRLVLMKRYWRFLKWEQIREEMKYEDSRSAYKVHNKALEEFIKIHGNNFQGH